MFRKLFEERHFRVRLSEAVLEGMAMAAVEAYERGDGRDINRLETMGYVWGRKREITDHETLIELERVSVSLAAKRERGAVEADDEAGRLKADLMAQLNPDLAIFGDFHTHPYKSTSKVHKWQGFEFSRADYSEFKDNDLLWERACDTPVMLAVTIVPRKHERNGWGGAAERPHVWRIEIGPYRMWVSASVGYRKTGLRRMTRNKTTNVALELPSCLTDAWAAMATAKS